ncbi:hypothetical protein [Fictibacillus sp. UD]|uniref:hypothetical protein n=1 Tax=Fictibacillus sp. UD TaxID=3038777 RepID=UPI00374A9721
MRHLYARRTNVAHRLPRGKRSTWNGNQILPRVTRLIKVLNTIFHKKGEFTL